MKTWLVSIVSTIFVGWAGVGLFMKKYGPNIFKGITIARDSLDLLDEVLEAIKPEADGSIKITPEEVKQFEELATKLRKTLTGGVK